MTNLKSSEILGIASTFESNERLTNALIGNSEIDTGELEKKILSLRNEQALEVVRKSSFHCSEKVSTSGIPNSNEELNQIIKSGQTHLIEQINESEPDINTDSLDTAFENDLEISDILPNVLFTEDTQEAELARNKLKLIIENIIYSTDTDGNTLNKKSIFNAIVPILSISGSEKSLLDVLVREIDDVRSQETEVLNLDESSLATALLRETGRVIVDNDLGINSVEQNLVYSTLEARAEVLGEISTDEGILSIDISEETEPSQKITEALDRLNQPVDYINVDVSEEVTDTMELTDEQVSEVLVRVFHPDKGIINNQNPEEAKRTISNLFPVIGNIEYQPRTIRNLVALTLLDRKKGFGSIDLESDEKEPKKTILTYLFHEDVLDLASLRRLREAQLIENIESQRVTMEAQDEKEDLEIQEFEGSEEEGYKIGLRRNEIKFEALRRRAEFVKSLSIGLTDKPSVEYMDYFLGSINNLSEEDKIGTFDLSRFLRTGGHYNQDSIAIDPKETIHITKDEKKQIYGYSKKNLFQTKDRNIFNNDREVSQKFIEYGNGLISERDGEKSLESLFDLLFSESNQFAFSDESKLALLKLMDSAEFDIGFMYGDNARNPGFLIMLNEITPLTLDDVNDGNGNVRKDLVSELIPKLEASIELRNAMSERLKGGENGMLDIDDEFEVLFETDPDFETWLIEKREEYQDAFSAVLQEAEKKMESRQSFHTSYNVDQNSMIKYRFWIDDKLRRSVFKKYTHITHGNFLASLMIDEYGADFSIEDWNELYEFSMENFDLEFIDSFNITFKDKGDDKVRSIFEINSYSNRREIRESFNAIPTEEKTEIVTRLENLLGLLNDDEITPNILKEERIGLYYQLDKKDLTREIDKMVELLNGENIELSGYYPDFAVIQNLFKGLSLAYGVGVLRDSMDIKSQNSEEMHQVIDGESLKLAADSGRISHIMGRGEGEYQSHSSRVDVVQQSLTLRNGRSSGISGPNGTGKTEVLNAFADGIKMNHAIPFAGSVTTNSNSPGKLQLAKAGFSKGELGMSLFEGELKQVNRFRLNNILLMDEALMGCPGNNRVALLFQVLDERNNLKLATGFASHQAKSLYRMAKLLDKEDQFDWSFVAPADRSQHEGIGGSFGIDVLQMMGASTEFYSLAREIYDMHTMGEVDYEVHGDTLKVRESEPTSFTDKTTIESAKIEEALGEFTKHGISKKMTKKMFEFIETRLLNDIDSDDLTGQIDVLEQMDFELLSDLLESNLGIFDQNYSLQSRDVLKDYRYKKADKVGGIISLLQNQPSVFNQRYGGTKAIELLKESGIEDGDTKQRIIYSIRTIEENSKEEFTATGDVLIGSKPMVERVRDLKEISASYQKTMTEIFKKMNIPEISVSSELDEEATIEGEEQEAGDIDFEKLALRMNKLLIEGNITDISNLKKNEKEILFDFIDASVNVSGLEDEFIFSDTSDEEMGPEWIVYRNLGKLVNDELAPRTILAASVALNTHKDSDSDISFCRTEIDESLKIPFAAEKAVNIPLQRIVRIKGEKYVPQDIYYSGGEAISDFDQERTTMSSNPSAMSLTGTQRGGKTESLRTQLQLHLWDKIFGGRVPAKRFVVRERPKQVLGVIKEMQSEGSKSTFMRNAGFLVDVEKRIANGTLVFLDEPAGGTDITEKCAIIAALISRIEAAGGHTSITNHDTELYEMYDAMEESCRPAYNCSSFSYDPESPFEMEYGKIGGSETFEFARRNGWSEAQIKLAELTLEIMNEFKEKLKNAYEEE